jgi:hypothetical protein
MALKSSLSQLKGSVHTKIVNLREDILYEIAFIESALDDPEHISLDGYNERLSLVTDEVLAKVNHLLEQSKNGVLLKNGINKIILRSDIIRKDIAKILYNYQKEGLTIFHTNGYEAPKVIKIKKPKKDIND